MEIEKKDYWTVKTRCDECDKLLYNGYVHKTPEPIGYILRIGRKDVVLCEDCFKKFKEMVNNEK